MKEKIYIASISGGKDSVAMVDRLIVEGRPLDYAIFYDGGMEFGSIYKVLDQIRPKIEAYGAKFVTVYNKTDFLYDMLVRPVNPGTDKEHYGYDWCGGLCRWATRYKIDNINKFIASLKNDYPSAEIIQYIGIAADEPERHEKEADASKTFPLVEWKMTEADALLWCYARGYSWDENGVELYSVLDRVSCWCCGNKNLKELRAIYHFLPEYWLKLKALQSRIDRPFRRASKESIFDLERRFIKEDLEKHCGAA